MNCELHNMDCRQYHISDRSKVCIVSDPPFNVGYHYATYKDNMNETEYYDMLTELFTGGASVVIHYPEALYNLAIHMQTAPQRVLSWVYNSNTKRQHRDVAYFQVTPDMEKVRQPYKNLTDKRIIERMQNGHDGTALYDWFYVDQIKNVGKEKTIHPCQMPIDVMLNVIGVIPEEYTIYDPFMGSGTTGIACAILGRDFIGCELDTDYFKLASERIEAYRQGYRPETNKTPTSQNKRLF